MAKPYPKRGFTLNLALYTLFRHENVVQSCILGPLGRLQ